MRDLNVNFTVVVVKCFNYISKTIKNMSIINFTGQAQI